jgi:hypothetical protein
LNGVLAAHDEPLAAVVLDRLRVRVRRHDERKTDERQG